MTEKGQRLPKGTDNNHVHVVTNSYLDTSKNHSNKINFDEGGSPYLDTSEDPSLQTNYNAGSPYLNR